jgi:hypothetical protein
LVEQLTLNQRVAGSSPASPTIFLPDAMKETLPMSNHLSKVSSKKMISVIVLVERPLSLSDPIFKLLKSNYPLSRIEVFLVGKNLNIHKNEVYKQFYGQFKSVKTIIIKSNDSIYFEVFPQTSGEICLFTSSDCSPGPSWVKQIVLTFAKNDPVGMVLGSVQQRQVDIENKLEQYCEQIGWGSTSKISGVENDYLHSINVEVLGNQSISRIVPLLRPVNMAFSRSLLSSLFKKFTVLDILGKIKDEKFKIIYNPEAEVERFHSMDFKELDREIQKELVKKTAWLSQKSKSIKIRIQFLGKHEWSMPFWGSVNICWGDFHWLNLFGLCILIECLTKGFAAHFSEDFWFADEVLLLCSAFGFFAFKYFLPVLKIQPWSDFILWCWIRYRTNMSMFLNGLWIGLKFNCFYWGESW